LHNILIGLPLSAFENFSAFILKVDFPTRILLPWSSLVLHKLEEEESPRSVHAVYLATILLASIAIRNVAFKSALAEKSSLILDMLNAPALPRNPKLLFACLGLIVNSDVLDGCSPDFQDGLHVFLELQPLQVL